MKTYIESTILYFGIFITGIGQAEGIPHSKIDRFTAIESGSDANSNAFLGFCLSEDHAENSSSKSS